MRTKFLVTLAVAIAGIGMFIMPARGAATFSFTVDGNPTGDGVSGAPGSTLVLATKTVDAGLIGRACGVTLDVHNNESVRQGTDLLIASGGTTLTRANVEAVAGDAPPVNLGNFVLGSTVTGSVRFGPRGEASVGATITIACPEPPTTTTLPTTTTRPTPPARPLPPPVVVRPQFTG